MRKMVLKACKTPSETVEQHTYEFDLVISDPRNNHTYILEMKDLTQIQLRFQVQRKTVNCNCMGVL